MLRRYFDILRLQPDFTRLWLAQAVSLLGDWFNLLVISAQISRFTSDSGDKSGLEISLFLLARLLPPLLVSPFAGVLLDRFDRKRILIASDIARALLVLMMLFVQTPDQLWLIYVLVALQFGFAALFEPGRSALLPAVIEPQYLVQANFIMSMTWSVMLAVGAVLGGLVASVLGRETALLIDVITYGLSAWLIWQVRPRHNVPAEAVSEKPRGAVRDYIEGFRYAAQHPDVAATLFVKLGGGVGSVDALVIAYGTTMFVLGEEGALSLGLLWGMFGAGALLGPFFARRFTNEHLKTMRRLIIVGYGLIVVGWLAFAAAPSLLLAGLAMLVKAIGSSLYWTYSSVILQKTVHDSYLGRMFSLDMAGFQLSSVISTLLTGWFLEVNDVEQVRLLVLLTAAFSAIPLVLWVFAVLGTEQKEKALEIS